MFKSKGFTLIELMIVIAIVGILFAVAAGEMSSKDPNDVSTGSDPNTPTETRPCG